MEEEKTDSARTREQPARQYTEIDFETKRRALEATDPTPSEPASPPTWKDDPDLLTWLDALSLCDHPNRQLDPKPRGDADFGANVT